MTYRERLEVLAQTKERQTQDKITRFGFMDEDDYGKVVPPEDFHWEPTSNHPNGCFYGAKGWADNFRSMMAVHPTYVDPVDALAGRWMLLLSRMRPEPWLPECSYDHLKPEQELYCIYPGIGADTHFSPDYRIGLELGWGGLLEKVRYYRKHHGVEKAEFFQAEEDVILAVQDFIRRTVTDIQTAAARETQEELRANLLQMAEANEWLVENAPRTLREACQWLAWFNTVSRAFNRDGAGGQLDELLRPYYEKDVAAELIDDEAAIYFIGCLLLNDPHYYQIGGPAPDGHDVTSRVSFLILEAAHRIRSTANLTVRVHDGLDKELFRVAVEYLFRDRKAWPRFSGDKALVEGFMRNGYPVELARERIAVGCNWMSIPGREYTLNDTVKVNVAKVFDVAMWEMFKSSDSPSVASLWQRLEDHLRKAVLCTARGIDFHLTHQQDNAPELLLNLLCYGPIEKGLDVSAGGVEFYNMCIDGAGLATVADSIAALEQRIEREEVLTWEEMHRHLSENYAGADGERVRQMLQHSERYGQGGSLGDEWAVKVSQLFTRLVKEHPTPEGRILVPGWFSWSRTIALGEVVGATPNGRKSGEPIAHGANPHPGFRKDNAATAMAAAVASVQCGYGNTAPIQLEFDPGVSEAEGGIEKVASLIKTHFDLGGTLFNINIIDAGKILAAHKNPELYPDLVVRVTGFTAYFAALSPEFRQLVVDRIICEKAA